MDRFTLTIDARERIGGDFLYFESTMKSFNLSSTKIVRKQLKLGDFRLSDAATDTKWIFERKTWDDLASSIGSNNSRFRVQRDKLSKLSDKVRYIIEGPIPQIDECIGNKTFQQLQGAILSLEEREIECSYTPSAAGTCEMLRLRICRLLKSDTNLDFSSVTKRESFLLAVGFTAKMIESMSADQIYDAISNPDTLDNIELCYAGSNRRILPTTLSNLSRKFSSMSTLQIVMKIPGIGKVNGNKLIEMGVFFDRQYNREEMIERCASLKGANVKTFLSIIA